MADIPNENEMAPEEELCSVCKHPVSAHHTALEADGELGDWHSCACLECGCTAFVEPEHTGNDNSLVSLLCTKCGWKGTREEAVFDEEIGYLCPHCGPEPVPWGAYGSPPMKSTLAHCGRINCLMRVVDGTIQIALTPETEAFFGPVDGEYPGVGSPLYLSYTDALVGVVVDGQGQKWLEIDFKRA